jgi:hypothetical protein
MEYNGWFERVALNARSRLTHPFAMHVDVDGAAGAGERFKQP